MAFTLKINGTSHDDDVDGYTTFLWVLRDVLGTTGTKFSCGRALCGARVTAALHRSITFKDRRVEQSNFDSYLPMRIDEVPVVETHT